MIIPSSNKTKPVQAGKRGGGPVFDQDLVRKKRAGVSCSGDTLESSYSPGRSRRSKKLSAPGSSQQSIDSKGNKSRRLPVERARPARFIPLQRCGQLRLMKVPSCNSETACRSCSCVFITIGPYHATGSSIGLPDTSRNRMPSSPACTTISSPRSNSTSE